MSKKAIRTGRYTKEIHRMNKKNMILHETKNEVIPYLFNQSDSQDLVVRCINLFYEAANIDWKQEVEDFELKFQSAISFTDAGLFSKSEYMDVYKVSGLEIDCRRPFMNFLNSIFEVGLKRFYKAIRNIPGLNELDEKNFIISVFKRKQDVQMYYNTRGHLLWTEGGLVLRIDDNHVLNLKKNDIVNLMDSEMAMSEEKFFREKKSLDVTLEESIFILVINLLTPSKEHPSFKSFQNRFILAFTKYLESTYGKGYQKRLLNLVNFAAGFHKVSESINRWMRNNVDYVGHIDSSGCMTKMWLKDDVNAFLADIESNKAPLSCV